MTLIKEIDLLENKKTIICRYTILSKVILLGLDLLLGGCNSTRDELLCETLSTFCAFSHDFYSFYSLV